MADADLVPYRYTRISCFKFSYVFQEVSPGQKCIRLHFNPVSYRGFEMYRDLFIVEAGRLTLLGNFSASLTAHALGLKYFVKEFWIIVEENQTLRIKFSPARSLLHDTYAFVNGIEIIDMPTSLYYTRDNHLGAQLIGHNFHVLLDSSTMLEMVHQLNIQEKSISQANSSGMLHSGLPEKQKDELLCMERTSGCGIWILNTKVDSARRRSHNDIHRYRDYVVIMNGNEQEVSDHEMLASIVVAVMTLTILVNYKLHKIAEAKWKKQSALTGGLRRFSLAEMQSATDNFRHTHIGKGGFGKVYRGLIDDGQCRVAIKKLAFGSHQGNRLRICIGAARGLDYLHTNGVIHRNVKSSNILLDDTFRAKISDFGFAKFGESMQLHSHVNTRIVGTNGYLDPDYVRTQQLTEKSDVYSFGVVLCEVLSGKRAVNSRGQDSQLDLISWPRGHIRNGDIDKIVEPSLRRKMSLKCLKDLVEISGKCLHDEPKKRPTVVQVVAMLEFLLKEHVAGKSDSEMVQNRVAGDRGTQHLEAPLGGTQPKILEASTRGAQVCVEGSSSSNQQFMLRPRKQFQRSKALTFLDGPCHRFSRSTFRMPQRTLVINASS
ncbi:UNVERIFIED_CONTAM: Receptor-like protein kinase ANXUR1 [Sesamum calycinum]|uniref:Receptor-like protein kinase ANXUR1 n=1 Tax=Sesamum calycinum TaxID=2727403 RepID=A0AAW2NE32_9LAMI